MKTKSRILGISGSTVGRALDVPDEFGDRAMRIADRKRLPPEMASRLKSLDASELIHFTEIASVAGGGTFWRTKVDGLLLTGSAHDGTLEEIRRLQRDMLSWVQEEVNTIPEGTFVL